MKHYVLKLLLVWGLLFRITSIMGQATQCGSYYFESQAQSTDPNYTGRRMTLENNFTDSVSVIHFDSLMMRTADISSAQITKVPIVVHLIGTSASAALTTQNIQSVISDLNDLFRKTPGSAGDGEGVDTQIEFCLATLDPNNIACNGIDLIGTGSLGPYCNSDDATIKALGYWDPTKYLNLWVCDLVNCTDKSWGSIPSLYFTSTTPGEKNKDGVVCDMHSFTAIRLAHEIGHWLGLSHTYGKDGSTCGTSDNDDGCSDTPWCSGSAASLSCNTINHQCSAKNGSTDRRQIENYMDDSDESCKNMFTSMQKQKMLNTLNSVRLSATTSGAMCPPTCDDGIRNGNETGIDCGGSCPPCATPAPPNCLTTRFKLNGVSSDGGQITRVCNNYGDIVLTSDCGSASSLWNEKIVTKDYLSSSDPTAYSCSQPHPLLQPNRYKCVYSKLFISVMECDQFKTPIANTEVYDWYTHNDPSTSVILHDFLQQKGYTLLTGHYYQVKVASYDYHSDEHFAFIQVYGPTLNLANQSIQHGQVADDITITNCSVNDPYTPFSPKPIMNFVAKNSISILPGSDLNAGDYKIVNFNCSQVNTFRTMGNVGNTGNDNGQNILSPADAAPANKTTASLQNNELPLVFNIVPNPSDGYFTLILKNAGSYPDRITINDLLGNPVMEMQSPEAYEFTFNLSDYQSGMYLVEITHNGRTYSKKIIKN